jgi:hypothetical protein
MGDRWIHSKQIKDSGRHGEHVSHHAVFNRELAREGFAFDGDPFCVAPDALVGAYVRIGEPPGGV